MRANLAYKYSLKVPKIYFYRTQFYFRNLIESKYILLDLSPTTCIGRPTLCPVTYLCHFNSNTFLDPEKKKREDF